MKILELFGGIGACSKALERIGIDYEIADYVEIDKYAVASFNAIHGTNFEPQDITKWDKDIAVDLIMHGSPCQDFSTAGLQAGGDKGSGTRSSLMYETLRIVEKLRPKYVIWENVKNLLSKKHRHNFDAYQKAMEELGYNNHYQVLNARDYGIPQNRERVFTVSIRKDLEDNFVFPEKQELVLKLKDILEDEVDEKYYLSDKALSCFMSDGTGNYPRRERFLANINRKNQNVGNAVTTRAGSRPTDNFVKDSMSKQVCNRAVSEGFVKPNDVIEYSYSKARMEEMDSGKIKTQNSLHNDCFSTLKTTADKLGICVASRGRKTIDGVFRQRLEPRKDELSNTLTTVQKDNLVALPGAYGRNFGSKGKIENTEGESGTLQAAMGEGGGNVPLVVPNYRIRKLTPLECWRLMGFSDSDFYKAEKVVSTTQLYKQAGNSIVVNVLESILSRLYKL